MQQQESSLCGQNVLRVLFTALIVCLTASNAGTAAPASPVPSAPGLAMAPGSTATAGSAGVLGGAADTVGGYAAQVLEKTLARWQPPAGTSGVARVLVRVGSDGRVLSCEATPEVGKPASSSMPRAEAIPGSSFTVTSLGAPQTGQGYQASPLTDSVCLAVGQAGAFGTPPYAMVTEVFLSLAAGQTSFGAQNAPMDYAQTVIQRVQPHVITPVRLKGSHTTRVHLKVRPDGSLEQIRVDTPSGNQAVDAAVLQAFTVPGVIPAPGENKDLVLTFTVNGE